MPLSADDNIRFVVLRACDLSSDVACRRQAPALLNAAASLEDPARGLEPEEITLSHEAQMAAFGEDDIDYDAARVVKGKYVFFQGSGYAVTPNGKIYYPQDCGNLAMCASLSSTIGLARGRSRAR